MDSRPAATPQLLFRLCGGLLLIAAAIAYVCYRQSYIGGCDWFGYYELGHLLASGTVFIDLPQPVDLYPSIVPLGFVPAGVHALPQYPPGYPLLLAISSWFHGELFVTPALGVLSIGLIYLAAREFAERWLAMAVAATWAFFPIVVFGSTNVMSDLVAALPLLGSYLLYRKGWLRTSALVLGTAFWVRPTNALFAILFAGILLRDRNLIRYVLWTLPTVVPYAIYNHLLYGAPWHTGYGNFASDLTATVFWQHLGFYLRISLIHLGPLVPFILLGLRRLRRSDAAFLLAWPAAYILFYSFWLSGGDAWWWIRFILPAYAPLFLLAASGLQQSAEWIRSWRDSPPIRYIGFAALLALVGFTINYQIDVGLATHDLWTRNKGRGYYEIVRTAAHLAPEGSYIGSVEFCGSVRLYTRCQSFFSGHSNAPVLVRDLLAKQTPVFLILEPWNETHPEISALRRTFNTELLESIQMWGRDVKIFRLTARQTVP